MPQKKLNKNVHRNHVVTSLSKKLFAASNLRWIKGLACQICHVC